MVWVDEKEVGIQLVGFFKGQVEARVRGKVTLFGNTLTWDESFDRDELLDAAGKFLSKVIKIIVKWFKENVEPFAVKFFQDNVCGPEWINELIEWCDWAAPSFESRPLQERRSYTFKGPYQEASFTRVVAVGQNPDERNLVYQQLNDKTLGECRLLCDRGLDDDNTDNRDRHGYWDKGQPASRAPVFEAGVIKQPGADPKAQYTKCYGFNHQTSAYIQPPPSINQKTEGRCRGLAACSASRGVTQCKGGYCYCQKGYYTVDSQNCIALPDFSKPRRRPSNAGKTVQRISGSSCRVGDCYSKRGPAQCTCAEHGGSGRRRRRNGCACKTWSVPGWRRRRRHRTCICAPDTPSSAYCKCGNGYYNRDGACLEQPTTQYDREQRTMRPPANPTEPSVYSNIRGTCTLYGESEAVPYYGHPKGNYWVANNP